MSDTNSIPQLKIGVILTYFHLLLYTLSGIFILPIILRKLGISQYGIYSLAYSIMACLTVLDLGFFNTAIRYFSEYHAKNDYQKMHLLTGMFLQIYAVLSLIVLGIGTVLYFHTDIFFSKMTPDECIIVKQCLWVITINVALTFPLSVFKAIAIAHEKFLIQKGLELLRFITDAVFIIILLMLGFGTFSLILVAALCNIAMLFFFLLYSCCVLRIRVVFFPYDWNLLKKLFKFSIFMFIIAVTARLYWNSGQFILAKFSGAEALGYFSISVQVCLMYCSLCEGISSVCLPRLTKIAFCENSEEQHADLFIRIGRLQFFLASLLLLGFVVAGRDFLYLWTGKDNPGCFIITLVLMTSVFLPNIESIGNSILEARNHLKTRVVISCITVVVAILFQWIFCIFWGEFGCGCGTALALLIGFGLLMNCYLAKKEAIAILLYLKNIGRMFAVLLLPAIFLFFFFEKICVVPYSIYSFLLKGFVFFVAYVICAWVFLMNRQEKQMILNLMHRKSICI